MRRLTGRIVSVLSIVLSALFMVMPVQAAEQGAQLGNGEFGALMVVLGGGLLIIISVVLSVVSTVVSSVASAVDDEE